MAPTPPASSPAARSDTERTRRRRPQQPAEDEDEDDTSSEEESGGSDESEEDSGDELPAPRSKTNDNAKGSNKNIQRPPPRPLNPNTNRSRTGQKSSGGTTGSSAPSYEDPDAEDSTYRQNSYSHLPTPPTQRQRSPLRQQQRRNQAPPQQAARPPRAARQRTATAPPTPAVSAAAEDSSYSSSSTASSAGPWKPYAPGGSSGRGTPSARPPMPGSSRRNRPAAREPAREPTQAIVPRAPRTVAAAGKIDDDGGADGGEEDETEVEFVPRGPASAPALPAGGKKAALAVELKLNLEIEIELKASIHGDVTLELFN